jgi:TRAP-type C4-dicarboxylate transport system substrate-binding protein
MQDYPHPDTTESVGHADPGSWHREHEAFMDRRTTGHLAAAVATAALVAACQAAPAADKAGAETVVLKLATIDSINNNGQSYGPEAFVENLETVSDGRLKVEVTTQYGQGAPEAESDLVEAIASGEVDGGWPSTRAFANVGITGLEAVEAPMTLTNYAAEKALVSGPVADKLLAKLDGTGVVGLDLAVGPLRRPFAAEAPLLGPGGWAGATFRVYNSPVQTDAVRLLGATPVNLGFGWIDEVRAGRLRGVEFDIAQYAQNGNTTEAGNVTANVVLWPKVFVLSISQKRFDALSDEQQNWVREAADKAMQVSVDSTYDETTLAQELCEKGARFIAASPDQIAVLRTSLQPVLDGLAGDPANGALLTEIQAIAADHPEPDVPTVPEDCRQGTVDAPSTGGVSAETADMPDGEYRVEITTDEVAAAGLDNRDGKSGTWTFTVRDGTYEMRCRPLDDPGIDCGHSVEDGPLDVGYLRGTGQTVTLVYDPELISELTGCKLPVSGTLPDHCEPGGDVTLTWEIEGDSLTFSGDLGRDFELVLEPWTKIG